MDASRGLTGPPTGIGAILLAGGRARRLDGAAKPLLRVGPRGRGERMLDLAARAALDAGCAPVTVVGPEPSTVPGTRRVREDPPFGGPVAAVAAALADWDEAGARPEWALLLACDAPRADEAVGLLLGTAPWPDGAIVMGADGRHRLVALLRTAVVRERLAALPEGGRDAPLRALLDGLRLAAAADPTGSADDVDTWEDLIAARRRAGTEAEMDERLARTEAWIATLRDRYGLAEEDVPVGAILDLARDTAHGVDRPAAPLTTFVAGLVAGRGGTDPRGIEEVVAQIAALAVAAGEGPELEGQGHA